MNKLLSIALLAIIVSLSSCNDEIISNASQEVLIYDTSHADSIIIDTFPQPGDPILNNK